MLNACWCIWTWHCRFQVRAESAEAMVKWLVVINGAAKLAANTAVEGGALTPIGQSEEANPIS